MTEPDKVEVEYRGRKVLATPIGFKSVSVDQPISYQLDDGSRLDVRYVLVQVLRIDGEYSEQGDPIYLFRQGAVPNVICPPDLKQPPRS